jgi:parallel beta-helix repeat protein
MSISFKMRIVLAALAASAGLYGQSVFAAATVVVGPTTCEPGKVHYTTIGAAISAVKTGSTVLVCPGSYPEQVAITQPITLKGVTDGTGNAAIITVPAAGLVINGSSPTEFGALTAQISVQNATDVIVSNLTIDGTGSGCVSGANREVGIFVYNTANSEIADVTVRYEQTGCASGEGIVTDTSYVTISSNVVHDIDRSGILVLAGADSVESNAIQNAALYGIGLYYTNETVVSSNTAANMSQAAIWVEYSNNSIVKSNTLLSSTAPGTNGAIGVWIYSSSSNSVSGNITNDYSYGIALQGSGNNVVQSNKSTQSGSDGLYEDTSLGGNIVSKNTVNEAAYGLFTDSSVGGDTLTPNTFYNTVVTVDPNPASIVTQVPN